MSKELSLNDRLGMPLDDVVYTSGKKDKRIKGGGKYNTGKRFSPRQREGKPYSRRSPQGDSDWNAGVRARPRNRSGTGGGSGSGTGGGSSGGARVYVGNLDWTTSWQDLKDHMRQAGNVVHADVFMEEDGRSKGCGVVEYGNVSEARKAIKMLNDTYIKDTDRPIFVREDREDKQFAKSIQKRRHSPRSRKSTNGKQIFVGNLPFETSWQDLKDAFREYGNILRADILYKSSGRSTGQGTVLYEKKSSAQRAIDEMDNAEFNGRKLIVHEYRF